MTYLDEIKKGMKLLAENDFYVIGQNTKYGGTSMYHTLTEFPDDHKIELPVAEEMQAGMSIGMSLTGTKVCSIYPRWDFMLLAINQIVNHADKVKRMSDGQFKLKGLIFRVAVGSVAPMFPGEQHCGDYTEALKIMCKDIKVIKLEKTEDIYPAYLEAIKSEVPTVLVEIPDNYNLDLKQEIKLGKVQ